MRKNLILGLSFVFVVLFSSCATKKLSDGEELVEYKDINYVVNRNVQLTKEQVREDCDMLKYILYNCYAGIDESISLGLDLDASIESIYEQTMAKKIPGSDKYARDDFVNIIRSTISKEMHIEDQHLGIDGGLKDSTNLYYSNVYFEKLENGTYVVNKVLEDSKKDNSKDKTRKRSYGTKKAKKLNETVDDTEESEEKTDSAEKNEPEVRVGQVYTGPEANLFETFSDGKVLYRFGVLTKIRVKTVNLSVDDEVVIVPVKTEEIIHQKQAWNGLKTTENTIYMSLSDCFNLNGLEDSNTFTEELFEKDMQKISEATKGKKNIIFDLRSNTGGYAAFPAKMLAAAYYFNSTDEQKKNIEALMLNNIAENCQRIVSPFTMQLRKNAYKDTWKHQFERLSNESKAFYKSYWRTMQTKPIRKYVPDADYQTNLTDFPKPDFQGRVYILINRNTVSAAELGTGIAFMLQNQGIDVKIVGENSWGGVKYVGVWSYWLPNTSVYMRIPSVIGLAPVFDEIPQFHGEGKGFYPDYWATSENILETLIMRTGDNELETALEGLGKEML